MIRQLERPYYKTKLIQHWGLSLVLIILFCLPNVLIGQSSEHIIGEERVGDGVDFAARMMAEAEGMWSSTDWKKERIRQGVLVESKPVSGVFESAGIKIMRSEGLVHASQTEVFEFLVSPAGFAILDPTSDPTDHLKPVLQSYPWKDQARLEAATSKTKIPYTPGFEFVVLNAIDYTTCTFVSKSIIHDSMPGGSPYSQENQVEGGIPRAVNTFAVKVLPVSETESKLLLINFVHMGPKGGAWIYDQVNKGFFAPVYRRLNKILPIEKE